MRLFPRVAAVLVGGLLAAAMLPGQDWRGKGRVDGWIKDPAGKPVADAKVELKLQNGGGTSTTTNKKGYWAVMGLRGGSWNVDVSAKGFEPRQISVGVSEAGRIPPMEIQLQPAAPAAPQAGAEAPAGGAGPEIIAAIEHGNSLLAEKKFAEARAEYEKALVAVPDNTAILGGIAQTWNGEGNKAKAVEVLKRITELDPADTRSRVLLANLLLEQGKLDEGKAMLDALPPGAITDPSVYQNVGILFMNKGKGEDARAYFTKAIELDPADPYGYYFRGLGFVQAKKNAEAKTDFKKFLELKPDAPEAAEVREILQALK